MPVLDLREQPPLEDDLRESLAAEIERRIEDDGAKTAGQTMLQRADLCPRSAAFYFIFGGGTESHATARGTLFHLFAEEMTNRLIGESDQSLSSIDRADFARTEMQALIDRRTDLVLPAVEQDTLRLAAWNWAQAVTADPNTLLCNEAEMSMELGGWLVRGRIDRADQLATNEVLIRDWKTSMNLPSQEDYDNDFQALTYALLFAESPLGAGVPGFWSRVELPRRLNEDTGELVYRETYIDHARLYDHKLALIRLLEQLDHGLRTGDFLAIDGSWCSTCPAPGHCPIDARHRKVYPDEPGPPEPIPSIESLAEAEALASEKLFIDARSRGIQKALRGWSGETGSPVRRGDLEWDFRYEVRRSTDHEGLAAAAERRAEFGEPFNPSDYIKVTESTPYKKKRVADA